MKVNTMKALKAAGLILLYIIGISIIGAMIKRVGVEVFFSTVRLVNIKAIIFAVLLFITSNILRGFKLFIFYKIHYKGIKYLQIITVYLASNALNNIIPGRSGDIFSIYIFKKRQNFSINRIGSILVIDKIVEVSLMILFLTGSILYLIVNGNRGINPVLFTLFMLLLIITILIIFLLTSPKLVRTVLKCKLFKFVPQIVRNKTVEFIDRFAYSCSKVGASGRLIQIAGITFGCWLLDFMALYVGINSITPVMMVHSITAQAISIPISVLSFIPNGLGISSLSYIGIAGLLGYDVDAVMIASVFIKVLFLLMIFLLGAIGAWGLRYFNKKAV